MQIDIKQEQIDKLYLKTYNLKIKTCIQFCLVIEYFWKYTIVLLCPSFKLLYFKQM